MRTSISVAGFSILLCIAVDAQAWGSMTACLFESAARNAQEGGIVQTCLEVGTSKPADFPGTCKHALEVSRRKLTDMRMQSVTSCPPNPDATCTNVLDAGLIRHHYGRSPEFLAKRKKGCTGFGGSWTQRAP